MNRHISEFSSRAIVTAAVIGVLALAGCNGTDRGVGGQSDQGKVILMMHDAPVDNFTEVWLTVESVTMIGTQHDDDGTEASGEVVLSEAVRMDFLALDSVSRILASAQVDAGLYSKIRLRVSDPEFVRDDDSVYTDDDIQLVANGHVDLNPQGTIVVGSNALTVVSLDLDLDNSVQVNETGNERYILRPQILLDGNLESSEHVTLHGCTVVSVDLYSGQILVMCPNAETTLAVTTNSQTALFGAGGLTVGLNAINVGASVEVVGELNTQSGLITAAEVHLGLH
ncbi:MAG TPA: DUF4382 domain-containing protein [candidate division Zixibacteria bacterium]|jgi:hypothetical protein